MAWLIPVIATVGSIIGQNNANHAAAANNSNQQQQSVANAQAALATATQNLAPWLKPGAAPYSQAQIGNAPIGPTAGAPMSVSTMNIGPQGITRGQTFGMPPGGGVRNPIGFMTPPAPPVPPPTAPSPNTNPWGDGNGDYPPGYFRSRPPFSSIGSGAGLRE